MYFRKRLAVAIAAVMISGLFQFDAIAQSARKPVNVPGKTFLPLRVLARPFVNIYQQADENSKIVEENVPVFQSYFVYTRPSVSTTGTKAEGWYEVGNDNRGTVTGWMKAEDVLEWKQTMCLAYEHPSGRKPVLMFDQLAPLRELVKKSSEERVKQAEAYYQQMSATPLPKDFPVIAMEPENAIDITKQFYLLPILEHAPIEIEGREGRLLKLASVPKSGVGGGTVKDSATDSMSKEAASSNPEADVFKKLRIDIVYTVDMTGSMSEYIQQTLQTIQDMSRIITQDAVLQDSVRFGLWGYRDSPDISGIEFNTKNFTPTLQQVGDFEQTLAKVKVAQVGSKDYPEDVFSGVDKAMRETAWNEHALRFIVLLGDAPSHELGHKWNYSGQDAETLREFADDQKFSIFTAHIKDREAKKFWELTEEQFRTLAGNRGLEGGNSYWSVDSKDKDGFLAMSKSIAGDLTAMLKGAKQGNLSFTKIKQGAAAQNTQGDVSAVVKKMGYAALVDWIGREVGAKAPKDIIAWVTDKDLIDPSIPSLDVRVLVNKNQLDSLRTVLQEIMTAGRRGAISGEKFFDALQAVPSAASRSGDQIRNAQSLADTDLIPEFMRDLPYKSTIMMLNNELWSSWSQDQQDEFLNTIDAKIQLYAAIHDEPSGWVPLTPGADSNEYVYPLALSALP